jgi:hypothetical protein
MGRLVNWPSTDPFRLKSRINWMLMVSYSTAPSPCSDAKSSGRMRQKLVHRRDVEQVEHKYAAYHHQQQQQQHRTNGFSNLNLSGLQPAFGTDIKGLPPSRRDGRGVKPGESGLTPSVGSIHLNGMSTDLPPGSHPSPYAFHQTPNGTCFPCRAGRC